MFEFGNDIFNRFEILNYASKALFVLPFALRQRFYDEFLAGGLFDKGVHAACEADLLVLAESAAADHHAALVAFFADEPLDALGSFAAIQNGHFAVHENQVDFVH